MIAIIANCAMVPPKLIPGGVSRKPGGVYSGNSPRSRNSTAPEDPLARTAELRPPLAQAVSRREHGAPPAARLLMSHARAFPPRLSPSMPVGRINSTSTSSTNATTHAIGCRTVPGRSSP